MYPSKYKSASVPTHIIFAKSRHDILLYNTLRGLQNNGNAIMMNDLANECLTLMDFGTTQEIGER